MKRRAFLPRSTKPLPKVNVKRQKRERPRKYGPKGRTEFVKALGCLVANKRVFGIQSCVGQIDNAHTEIEGASRKGHYTTIVNLCRGHHLELGKSRARFESRYEFDLDYEAALVEEQWVGR